MTPELQALADAAERYGDRWDNGGADWPDLAALSRVAKAYAASTRKARQEKEKTR